MNKVYSLSTCDTCRRILKEVGGAEDLELQDIKKEPISSEDLDALAQKIGSYEALFSRKSLQYKVHNLKGKTLTEQDYRSWILKEYTFLKRPVFLINQTVFAGNASATVAAVKERMAGG